MVDTFELLEKIDSISTNLKDIDYVEIVDLITKIHKEKYDKKIELEFTMNKNVTTRMRIAVDELRYIKNPQMKDFEYITRIILHTLFDQNCHKNFRLTFTTPTNQPDITFTTDTWE